jgi:signal transduction histidine kinase
MMFIISYFKEREKIKERETQRLKDLEEAKTRLYTNVTHEFRTPLTIILGLADQLKEKGTGFLEEVSLIRKNGKRLLRLVNELLGLARLESGLERVNLVRLDVIPYFHYLTDAFQLTAQNQGIDLQWHTDLPKWEMDLDQDKWEIIFGNLISNALKFTPKGGQIKVDVTTVPSSNEAKEDRLQLTIADNGPGIPGEGAASYLRTLLPG